MLRVGGWEALISSDECNNVALVVMVAMVLYVLYTVVCVVCVARGFTTTTQSTAAARH